MEISKYGIEISTLGGGSYGTVKLYRQNSGPDKGSYAVKFIKNYRGIHYSAIIETAIMVSLNHPNVVKLVGYDLSDHNNSILVMPAAKSDLDGTLLTELDDINNTFYQMASSLCYIHNQGIIHKDIKPQNFLISNSGQIWVADFGLSRIHYCHNEGEEGPAFNLNYRPPEVVAGHIFSEYSDIWALGATFIELITGEKIFKTIGQEDRYVLQTIYRTLGRPDIEFETYLKSGYAYSDQKVWVPRGWGDRVLGDITQATSQKNIFDKLIEIIPHRLYEIIMSMLSYNPNNRPSAFDIINDSYFREIAANYTDYPCAVFDCVAKLDMRYRQPPVIPITETGTKYRKLLIGLRTFNPEFTLTYETISVGLYLMDVLDSLPTQPDISDSRKEIFKFYTVIKLSAAIYETPIAFYEMTLLNIDAPIARVRELIPYESSIINQIVEHLNVSTSYMYLIEYIKKLGSGEWKQRAIDTLFEMMLTDIRFSYDGAVIALSAIFIVSSKSTIPGLNELVEPIQGRIDDLISKFNGS